MPPLPWDSYYTLHSDTACSGRNELGSTTETGGPEDCASICNRQSGCRSFEFDTSNNKCYRSASCTLSVSIQGGTSTGFQLYVKNNPMYDNYNSRGCSGRNEIYDGNADMAACVAMCDEASSCLSFEHRSSDDLCHVSSTCTHALSIASTETDLYVKAPPPPPWDSYYTLHSDTACSGRNELGSTTETGGPAACATLCAQDNVCKSFEFDTSNDKCYRSTSCTLSNSNGVGGSTGFQLYVKNRLVYDQYDAQGCSGRNELYAGTADVATCAAACDADSTCVSFEHNTDNDGCQRSTTCISAVSASASSAWHLFVKSFHN